MLVRIWSRKVVSVLRYFHHHPHCTLFGITGDMDNLGVYVARNGRAQAEMLVDAYNRLVGSTYYDFVESRPHQFFETCFLPSGEEIFVLGACADTASAESLFEHLRKVDIPAILTENIPLNVGETNITFGSATFQNSSISSTIRTLLSAIGDEDTLTANALYAEVVGQIRKDLAVKLDREKFSSLKIYEGDEVLLRNIVYLKTLEYKKKTKLLLTSTQQKFEKSPNVKSLAHALYGKESGLGNIDAREALETLLRLLK